VNEVLQTLLVRADVEAAGVFTADEVEGWPTGTVETFVGLGLLRETAPAKEVLCLECSEGCWIEPEVGRFTVDLARRRRWEFDAAGTAAAVAAAIKASGPVQELRASRLYFLGTVAAGDLAREVFFARGLAWNDALAVLSSAGALRGAAAPTVLVPARRPPLEAWSEKRPFVVTLVESATLKRGKLKLDLSTILPAASEVAPGEEPEWITVTQAAELLAKDFNMTAEEVKAKVSINATRKKFRTNGKKGPERRIELHSFNTWRLAQRDKDLDAADW